jgi:hypothetical protein
MNFRVLSIRNLFLSIKALRFDLELLEKQGENLFHLIDEFIEIRKYWYIKKDVKFIGIWFDDFYKELVRFCQNIFNEKYLVLPYKQKYRLGRNNKIMQSGKLFIKKKGMRLPAIICSMNKDFKKINNRLMYFTFGVPFKFAEDMSVHLQRFKYYSQLKIYNEKYLPYFTPFANQLLLKIV